MSEYDYEDEMVIKSPLAKKAIFLMLMFIAGFIIGYFVNTGISPVFHASDEVEDYLDEMIMEFPRLYGSHYLTKDMTITELKTAYFSLKPGSTYFLMGKLENICTNADWENVELPSLNESIVTFCNEYCVVNQSG